MSKQPAGSNLAHSIEFKENGVNHRVVVEPYTSLLDLLREQLQLTGTKKGCDHGQCGACTILIDDVRVNSCLCLAVIHSGASIKERKICIYRESAKVMQSKWIKRKVFSF